MSDAGTVMAERLQQIVDQILDHDDLAGDDWDAYGVVAHVQPDNGTTQIAFRYLGDGPPIRATSIREPKPLIALRQASRGDDGGVWDALVVKIHRPTAKVDVDFVYADRSAAWLVTHENLAHLEEALRPSADG